MTPSLSPGSQVGGFRIKRLVGIGATGEIYQAVDERLGRLVAVKLLKPSVAIDEKTVQRFLDEARTTARFNHPHIITVHAAGSFNGQPWLALEYLDGDSLRSRLDASTMSVREAMRLMKAVCEGVAEAHRHHIVHADLKPENVIVPGDGRLRVIDFGLSRLMGSDPTAASGTPAYMAPERWVGHAPTPAIDVWAVGVMLHELIEGTRPLSDAQLAAYVYAPGELQLGPKVAEQVCASLIARCLSADPAQRPSIDEVALQLASMLEGLPGHGEERAPYRGLDSFSEADAIDLQGREADVDAFVELLRRQTLVPLTGPSGIGKSSFLQAGVIPRLREQDRWTVIRCRPGVKPLWSLANALVTAAPLFATSSSRPESSPVPLTVDEVLGTMTERPGALEGFIARLSAEQSSRVLLVIDQFEELFTLASAEEAQRLVEALRCMGSVGQTARVVLSLRDDFLNAFAAMVDLRECWAAMTVLPPLGRGALVEAVSAPLRRVRFAADSPDLATRIADELEGQPSALPLLQFACRALWERRDSERRLILTREYEAMGGATGALAAHAQRFLAEALPEERALTRTLVLKLVNADSTRRPRVRSQLLSGLEPRAEVVLDRLLAHRLLVSGRIAENDEALIELAHESLVSTWPALTRWLTETQEARKLSHEIEQAAALWASRGRRDDETWSGPTVRQALERAAEWKLSLSSGQRQFLQAGRDRERLRTQRRRRWFIAAFIAVTTLALGASAAAYAFRQQQLATLAQQRQMTLAAADMGAFDLRLEPFDWSVERRALTPAAVPPNLNWRLHAPDVDAPNQPGRLYTEKDLVRHGAQVVDGGVQEHLEVRSGSAILVIEGRGALGQECAPSQVFLKHLPGYSERGVARTIRILVPTCEASLAGMVVIPAGPFMRSGEGDDDEGQEFTLPAYALGRTEATMAQYAPYQQLSAVTGDTLLKMPPMLRVVASDDVPVAGLAFGHAERFCHFWGRRLPSYDEWQKAYRGGLVLPSGKNPKPARLTLCNVPKCANLAGVFDVNHLVQVGQFALDVSPYGLLDLEGNVSEWTSTTLVDEQSAGLQVMAGGNWGFKESEHMHHSNRWNTHVPEYVDFASGVRCASDVEAREKKK